MAISPEALAALEKSRPDLVAQYRAKMQQPNADVQSAQTMQDYGSIANTFGKALTDLGNANGPRDVVLHNRMQDLGRGPDVRTSERMAFDPSTIDNATSRNLQRAKDAQSQASADFGMEQRLVDVGQARADADLQRADQQLARDQKARSNDPKSAESEAARQYLQQIAPTAAQMPNFGSLTEAQVYKVAPGIMDRYKLDEQQASRREEAAQRSADRAAMAGERRAIREDERTYKEGLAAKAADDKKRASLVEVDDRTSNITQNLDKLTAMIEDNGTWEAFGSHNQNMDRLVDAVATDMAKLADPSSVARPSEVEAVKRNLIQSGFKNSNDTAKQIIKNFRAEVEARKNTAYKVRGLEAPAPAGNIEVQGVKMPDGRVASLSTYDQEALAWARANPSDPRAQKIINALGGQ